MRRPLQHSARTPPQNSEPKAGCIMSRSPWIQHGIWKTDEQRSTARAPITAAPGTQPWRRCRGPTAPCLCTTSRGRRGGAGWAAEPAAPCRRPTFPRRSLASRGRRLRPSVPVPRRPPRRRPPRRVTEKRLEPCRCPLARRRPTQASRSSRHHGPMTVPRGIRPSHPGSWHPNPAEGSQRRMRLRQSH